MDTINARIKKIRITLGLDVQEFSEKLGIHIATVYRVETAKTDASKRLIRMICERFNISSAWIKSGEGEMFADGSISENIARLATHKSEESQQFSVLDAANKAIEAERRRADVLEKNNNILLQLIQKLMGGDSKLDISNFLLAPELASVLRIAA